MAGPTVTRLQLGAELRRLREAAGMSPVEVADALKCSRGRIGHIEKGRNVIGYAELIVLLRDRYRANQATIDALEILREEASKKGWWSTYGLPEWLAGYVGLENDARAVRAFEVEMIPGLLQTEQYASAQYSLDDRWSTNDVKRRVTVHMQRQERLTGPDPLQLTAVISEGALVRCARQRALAAAQLACLIDRAQWSNVELHILPFNAGLHVGAAGGFSLLTFPDHLLPDTAYQEYAVGGDVSDDESVVSQLSSKFGKLRSQALGVDESVALITKLAGQLD